MRFLAHYWWLLAVPVFLLFWLSSIRRITRSQAITILRIIGAALVLGTSVWLVTGDINTPYFVLHVGGGWTGAVMAIVLGVLALLGAQRLAKSGPPA